VHTAPGTTVPLRIVRNGKPQSLNITIEELNVDDEIGDKPEPVETPKETTPEPKETGFGMTVEPLTPQLTRRLSVPSGQGGAIVADIDPRGAAYQAGIAPTDVILSVNGTAVSTPDQVVKALDAIPSGHIARVLVWRTIQGQRGEQMVTLRKK
jgi:serine protease Do